MKGGVSDEFYHMLLRQKAFYNFIVKKRYFVTKDIVRRYLIPLPQVIALFSFIYPEAYLNKLTQELGIKGKDISSFKQIKRIKIYQYFVSNNERLLGGLSRPN